MNALHCLDSVDAVIQVNGNWISAADLISQAVEVWANGTDAERVAMQGVLNSLNESSSVPYIHANPCSVVYP